MLPRSTAFFWVCAGISLGFGLLAAWDRMPKASDSIAFLFMFAAIFFVARTGVRWAHRKAEHKARPHA